MASIGQIVQALLMITLALTFVNCLHVPARNTTANTTQQLPTEEDGLMHDAPPDCHGCGRVTWHYVMCVNRGLSRQLAAKWDDGKYAGEWMYIYGRWNGRNNFVVTRNDYDHSYNRCKKLGYEFIQPKTIQGWYKFEIAGTEEVMGGTYNPYDLHIPPIVTCCLLPRRVP